MKPLAFILFFLGCSLWPQAQNVPVEKILGLWAAEQMYGPTVRGELTIDTREKEWHAVLAGFDTSVEHHERKFTFGLPGDHGEFRGRFTADKGRSSVNGYNHRDSL